MLRRIFTERGNTSRNALAVVEIALSQAAAATFTELLARLKAIRARDDPCQVLAQDRRTPPGLDVLDHQFGSPRMADERPLTRIVHGICQVSRQDHLEAELRHLPGAEGSVEYADVGVNTHQGDVGDALLLAEVVDLLPVVTDAVKAGDIDGRVLASPGIYASPLLQDRVIAAAFDVIDGEFLRLLGLAGATSQNRHG